MSMSYFAFEIYQQISINPPVTQHTPVFSRCSQFLPLWALILMIICGCLRFTTSGIRGKRRKSQFSRMDMCMGRNTEYEYWLWKTFSVLMTSLCGITRLRYVTVKVSRSYNLIWYEETIASEFMSCHFHLVEMSWC